MPIARRLSIAATLLLACTGPGVAAQPAPVARIGDEPVSMQDLGPESAARLEKIQRGYERRRNELERTRETRLQDTVHDDADAVVARRVLEKEAAATGTTPEALLAAVPVPAVTPAQIRHEYAQHARDYGPSFSQAEPALRASLTDERREAARRAYLRALKARFGARVLAEPARLPVIASGPSLGPAGAAVTLVLYSDLECPYCRRILPTLEDLLARYPQDLRLVYRHLPLTGLHEHAYEAARAAACADRQGRFWEFVRQVFADDAPASPARLRKAAAELHLDLPGYDACLGSPAPAAVVDADAASGEALGLTATPTLLVNGRVAHGAVPLGTLAALVDDELEHEAARAAAAGSPSGDSAGP